MAQIKYLLYACVLLALMLAGAASHAREPAIDLAPLDYGQALISGMQILKEQPDTALSLADLANAEGWQPATPRNVSSVLRASTVWLTGTVSNNSPEPITRWISVGYWRLADVQMFLLDPLTDQLQSHMRAGLKQPGSSRPLTVPTMESVFPIGLEPGQQVQMTLRVQSGGWRTISVDSWSPSSYVYALQQTRILHSLIAGVALASAFLLLLSRQRLYVLLATWLAIAITASSLNLGYGITVLSTWLPGNALSALVATLATWDYTLLVLITAVILGLYKRILWRRVLFCVLAAGVACSVLFFFIDTLWLRRIIAVSLITLLAIWPPMLWAVRHSAWGQHRLMVVLLGLEWISQAIRMVAYDTLWLVDYDRSVYLFNIYGQVIILLLIIGLATLHQKRQLHRLEQQAKSWERDQREQLESLVKQRSIELEHSMLVAQEATKAKTEFLSHVSHDLRSPLATVIGYTKILQTKVMAADSAKRLVVIGRTADHMLNIIDDLVEYTRDSGENHINLESVYTTFLVDIIAQQARTLAETNNNHFVLQIENALPTVIVADSKRLRRMLLNLLDNASKFTRNGRVELHVHCQPAHDPDHVRMHFSVRDTGCGIHPDDQAKLFEPFFRGRSTHGSPGLGLGLGMRMVSMWVERMHGKLHVKSQLDQGTEVTIELSFRLGEERDVQRPPPVGLSPTQLKGEGRTLWVIEDIPEVRQYLTDWLIRHDFVVLQSPDGAAFIEAMQANNEAAPSAVLTDYYMPRAGGKVVLAAVRQHWPSVPVLLLSAQITERSSPDQIPGQEFDACLSKPIDFTMLAGALSRLLGLAGARLNPSPQDMLPTDENTDHENMRPPEVALAALAQLVENGALTGIEEWAQTLRTKSPEHTLFALEVERLAEEIDLHALNKLIAQSQ